MRRSLIIAYLVQLAVLFMLFAMDLPDRTTTKLAIAGGNLIFAALIVLFFVAAPLAVKNAADRRGRTRLGAWVLGAGIVALLLFNYVVLVVPTIWENYSQCLPPGVMEAGNCELGPL